MQLYVQIRDHAFSQTKKTVSVVVGADAPMVQDVVDKIYGVALALMPTEVFIGVVAAHDLDIRLTVAAASRPVPMKPELLLSDYNVTVSSCLVADVSPGRPQRYPQPAGNWEWEDGHEGFGQCGSRATHRERSCEGKAVEMHWKCYCVVCVLYVRCVCMCCALCACVCACVCVCVCESGKGRHRRHLPPLSRHGGVVVEPGHTKPEAIRAI